MPTTQPPLIVAVDGESKVSVRNTAADPVNVMVTNLLDGPPSVLCFAGKKLQLTLRSVTSSPIVVIQRHGAWLEVSQSGISGWINTNTITGDTFVLWA
jgi:hypothetical protein